MTTTWPLIRRRRHLAELALLQHELEMAQKDRDRYRIWHWNRCDCHDAWDKCNCASAGHPRDGLCGCCDLGTGICGRKPERIEATP